EWLPINLRRENRKILANAGHIVTAIGDCGMHACYSLPTPWPNACAPVRMTIDGSPPCLAVALVPTPSGPCAHPRLRDRHQGFLDALLLNSLKSLPDEGRDQQRLGFLLRQAARFNVKQEILVERARGRTVPALHVISEDLQLRLVVRLGPLGQ